MFDLPPVLLLGRRLAPEPPRARGLDMRGEGGGGVGEGVRLAVVALAAQVRRRPLAQVRGQGLHKIFTTRRERGSGL